MRYLKEFIVSWYGKFFFEDAILEVIHLTRPPYYIAYWNCWKASVNGGYWFQSGCHSWLPSCISGVHDWLSWKMACQPPHINPLSLHRALLIYTDQAISSWWLQMPWCQIGTRPSATTMLTQLCLYRHLNHCVSDIMLHETNKWSWKRGPEVGNPLVSLLFRVYFLTGITLHVWLVGWSRRALHKAWILWGDKPDKHMMTSSNGNSFRITGPLCGEFIGPLWIPGTKASDAELWCFLWSAPG